MTTHLPDGTPVHFEEGALEAIGERLARDLAAEDRLAHWRDEEALAEARHDLALSPNAASPPNAAPPSVITTCAV